MKQLSILHSPAKGLHAAQAAVFGLMGLVFVSPLAHADDPIDLRPVAATAVSASTWYYQYDPFYVSDWSGMTGTFPEGVDDTGAWQWSSDGNLDPSQDWIAWDLGDTYTLSKVHVWNDNAYGDGVKTLDVETSPDGFNWTPTAYTGLSWPDAPGKDDYAGFDQEFSTPIKTRYIRFANFTSYGAYGPNYVAIDEVVFYEAPGTGKNIRSFSVLDYEATVTGTTITQPVPPGTDLKKITPTITISAHATVSPASGEAVDFSTVNPRTYTVTAADKTTKDYQVTVTIADAPVVSTYLGVYGTNYLDPITNLMALTPSARGIQVENIDYHGVSFFSLPGMPGADNFSLLWEGWFDVLKAGGHGDYTFGTSSDDGSVIYMDLDRDGQFTSPGELIVTNNAVQGDTAQLATVTLTNDSVHFVIGFFQGNGAYDMRAGWAAGIAPDFSSLTFINGNSGYFLLQDPHPSTPPVATLPLSGFKFVSGTPTFTHVPTTLGSTYYLTYKDTLTDPTWKRFSPGTAGTGGEITLTDPTAVANLPADRFYKLLVTTP